MCLQILPSLLAAGGAIAGNIGDSQATKDRDRIAAQGLKTQMDLRRQAQARVGQEIQKTATSNPDAEKQAAQNEFIQALQKAKLTNGGAGYDSTGATSDRFAEDVGTARAASGAEAKGIAGNLAAIDAPMRQRQIEGEGRASAASDLSLLGGQSAGQDFLTQLRAANAHGSPWLDAASQGLSGFGGALATRAPRKKALPISEIIPSGTRIPQGTTSFYG